MTTTEADQLRIARAIEATIEAHEGRKGWATESMRGALQPQLPPLVAVSRTDGDAGGQHLVPRPLTTLAAALEAWVASGGDPERGPCFHWCSGDGDRLAWSVGEDGTAYIRVGKLEWYRGDAWPSLDPMRREDPRSLPDDLELLARIIRAVETEVTRAR